MDRTGTSHRFLVTPGSPAGLDGIDTRSTGGAPGDKDGAIKKVFGGVNPQGCRVTSFKTPSEEERSHDLLWRIHKATPAAGEIAISNRSHYEDVLIVRVHDLVPQKVIPADRKWYRDWAVLSVLVETLHEMDPQYPDADPDLAGLTVE